MIIPEVTRIINAIGTKESFSTYEANEFFPRKTAQQMGSILRRDERLVNMGKKSYWIQFGILAYISMWKVVDN